MSKVKGTKITSKLSYLEETWGAKDKDQVLASMSKEDQTLLRGVVTIGWYEQGVYDRLMTAIVNIAAGGDSSALDRMGVDSANHLSSGSYKAYFLSKDPEKVIQHMVPMHKALNDPGEMDVERKGPGHLLITVKAPRSTETGCRVARSFYRRCVELCDAKSATVVETQCSGQGDRYCRFDVKWNS